MPPNYSSQSRAWLEALDEATAVLRTKRGDRMHDDQSAMHNSIHSSLAYLAQLEGLLNSQVAQDGDWYRPPSLPPPPFYQQQQDSKMKAIPMAQDQFNSNSSPTNPFAFESSNPFAFLDHDDDDESSEDEDDETGNNNIYTSTTNNSSRIDPNDEEQEKSNMVLRRVWMRLLTSQSDLLACLSELVRKDRYWLPGAEYMAEAHRKIEPALVQADSYVAQWIDEETSGAGDDVAVRLKRQLEADLQIIVVAVQHVSRHKERFQKEAEMQKAKLLRKLQPQWQRRDDVKRQMGDRWYHNPHPTQNFARERQRDEDELRDIERALEQIRSSDTAALQDQTSWMQSRLNGNNSAASHAASAANNNGGTEPHRYNGLRPVDLSRRVSQTDYPDPTTLGWTFTGSSEASRVEFFERMVEQQQLVKLDWYYTTGTVKTSLDHPTQGKTQLFASGRNISPAVYRKILSNPRTHTGGRYHHKKQQQGRGRQQQQGGGGRQGN